MIFEDLNQITVINDINEDNLSGLRQKAQSADLYLESKFSLPDSLGAARYGINSVEEGIEKIAQITSMEELSENIKHKLSVLTSSNDTIAKNTLIKIIHWLTNDLNKAVDNKNATIFCNTKIGKYEMLALYILSKCGCNITIILQEIDKLRLDIYENIEKNILSTNQNLKINLQLEPNFEVKTSKYSDKLQILKDLEHGEFSGSIYLGGCNDKDALSEFLVKAMGIVISQGGLVFKNEIEKPLIEEIQRIRKPANINDLNYLIKELSLFIEIKNENEKNIAKEVFLKEAQKIISKYTNGTILFNRLSKVIIWLNRYNKDPLKGKTIMYFGMPSDEINIYLNTCIGMGVNILFICTKTDLEIMNSLEYVNNGIDMDMFEFPKVILAQKVNTLAFDASKEVDILLYNGETIGLYRDRQFSTCDDKILNTTYEEIEILWNQEMKVRPNFEVNNNVVTVPNIFAVINGCQEDYQQYLKTITKFCNENTIVYYEPDFVKIDNSPSKIRIEKNVCITGLLHNQQKKLIVENKLDIESIMGYRAYNYGFLKLEMQYHIMSKIQRLIEIDCINYKKAGKTREQFTDLALTILLNLDSESLRLIQWFDFTKQSPKIIVISSTEKTLTLEDSIMLAYYSLLGFDILVFVPTGYISLEKYIEKNMYTEHILGQPKFNVIIKEIKNTSRPEVNSAMKKIFGKFTKA